MDHTNAMSVDEVAALLERRARIKEMTYDTYEFDYLPTLRSRGIIYTLIPNPEPRKPTNLTTSRPSARVVLPTP